MNPSTGLLNREKDRVVANLDLLASSGFGFQANKNALKKNPVFFRAIKKSRFPIGHHRPNGKSLLPNEIMIKSICSAEDLHKISCVLWSEQVLFTTGLDSPWM